jgi:penicillin-binding protein 1A
MTSFRRALARTVRVALFTSLALIGVGAVVGYRAYRSFESDLPPRLDVVTDYRPLRASQVFSVDGELIGQFYVEKRVLVPVDQIPRLVKQAFVAAEDVRFYSHGGVDYLGIARAAWANLRAGRVVQGGSTITQQVAKLLIVGQERSLGRKVREAMLAHRIEQRLSKDQILGIYLNHVYLGHGAYGVAAAAAAYFGKDVKDLSVAEAALLAGLPKAPGRATPFHDFPRAQGRQRYVLEQMQALGFVSRQEADRARQEPVVLVSRARGLTNVAAPYFVETIRRYVADNYGDEELLERGLRVFTTLDMRKQRAAEAALRSGLEELQHRIGAAGPIGHLDAEERRRLLAGRARLLGPTGTAAEDDERDERPLLPGGSAVAFDPETTYAAVVTATGRHVTLGSGPLIAAMDPADEARLAATDTQPARVAVGDLLAVRFHAAPGAPRKGARGAERLTATLAAPAPAIQGALIALDPSNGHLVSMVGGYDYGESQFNRAVQAHRQIGSAMKPFIYATALEHGMNELTIKYDMPVKFKTSSGVWAPHNYKRDYLGPLTLRTAIAKSVNTVSAQLVAQMGVDSVIDTMRRLGIRSPLPHSLSLALGTADLTLQEVAYGLATFAAGGQEVTPVSIIKIVDAEGRVLEDHSAPRARAQRLSAETAYVVTDLMKGVVEIGTAKKARELGRPAAGKTGTSTNYRDAWFFGFTPELLCGVWVGRDDFKPIAHDATGGQVALPIWLSYMRHAVGDAGPDGQPRPVRDFSVPPGIVFARADPDKGVPAPPSKPGSRLTPFRRGTLPAAFKTAAGEARFSDEQF